MSLNLKKTRVKGPILGCRAVEEEEEEEEEEGEEEE